MLYILNVYKIHPVGIAEISIFATVFVGNFMLRFGNTIIILNKKYKKFALKVAIPTPIKPNFGIITKFSITPIIPEITLIINSIWVLFARWY